MEPSEDIAYRLLRLEEQLDAYRELHIEELEEIRRSLKKLKDHVLSLHELKRGFPGSEEPEDNDSPPK